MDKRYVAVRNDMHVDTLVEDEAPIYDCGIKILGIFNDLNSAYEIVEKEAKQMLKSMICSDSKNMFDSLTYITESDESVYKIYITVQRGSIEYDRVDYTIAVF